MDEVLNYFNGDIMSTEVWKSKYQLKNKEGIAVENTPADMHKRLAKEFARIEYNYIKSERYSNEEDLVPKSLAGISSYGIQLLSKRLNQSQGDIEQEFFNYFDKFSQIVPQGSIMSNLGNFFIYGSLSNCFTIASPSDSYAGIMRADQELAQLMKRRGGVGLTLNKTRPKGAYVSNAAKTSSGIPGWMERYSNTTREVAQEGRRGALMELLSVQHPDIFLFVRAKSDRTKVTGANISVMFTDEFMKAVENNEPFICTFPIDVKHPLTWTTKYEDGRILTKVINPAMDLEFNKLIQCDQGYVMQIMAKELFNEFVHQAHDNAEPGAAYMGRILDYSPDGVYEQYKAIACNPCSEIWMHDYETCRLIALNFFGFVNNPFTSSAEINFKKLYECAYMQQRLGDDLVDLEIEYIDRILNKLNSDRDKLDPLGDEYLESEVEIRLWNKIKKIAQEGRRTGGGFTGLGDIMAALGIPYYSPGIIEEIMRVKMEAELDATIDMAITRGTFTGWNNNLEYPRQGSKYTDQYGNSFYLMLHENFPEQCDRMMKYGRRNVSFSTVAPTGTVSLMTQTTSGLEPLFKAYYIRRKKINSNDGEVKVDFVDDMGDKWQEFPVLHPKFKDWLELTCTKEDYQEALINKELLSDLFEASPWFHNEADNISWENRIEIQSIIQKYTSNAISSTINLPGTVSEETVFGIYMEAWRKGLKGVTIYRDGSRSGVLIADTKVSTDKFGYTNAIKRPMELEADYHYVVSNGNKYAVIVGLLENKPYEIFAFDNPIVDKTIKGIITKEGKGVYSFKNGISSHSISNIQLSSFTEERVLTRWTSQLLRHGVNPKYIADQVDKSEVIVTSFAKAISRVLKTYIPNEITGESCLLCGEKTIIYEEGCKKCTSCGNSKC